MGRNTWSDGLYLLKFDADLLSWRWLNTCLSLGSKRICFALLVCTGFALCIKFSLSQPKTLLIFTLLIYHVGVRE